MSTYRALVYVSTATQALSPLDFTQLLERTRARHLENSITGVLLYNEGNFMQYLEGPTVAIDSVYDDIKADPLHCGIIELMYEPIKALAFPEWSMAFRWKKMYGSTHLAAHNALLSGKIVPSAGKSLVPHVLLSRFWSRTAPYHPLTAPPV